MTTPAADRLAPGGGVSAVPWVAMVYLLGYLVVGSVLFVAAALVCVVAAIAGLFSLGLPVLAGCAVLVRGCAEVERARSALVGVRIRSTYRDAAGLGVLARIEARWTDPAVLRDLGYLIVCYPPLLLLDLAGLVIWLAGLTGVSFPAWYWALPASWGRGTEHFRIGLLTGADGVRTWGIWAGDLPTALAVAGVSVVITLAGVVPLVAAARAHRAVVTRMLGPVADPLAAAKRVLAAPGPLTARLGGPKF